MKQEKSNLAVEQEYNDWRSAFYVVTKQKLWGRIVILKNKENGKYVIQWKE